MKIKGQISILISGDSTTIELRDKNSCVLFANVTLTPEQLSMALSRLAYTPCEIELAGLDKLGKVHENKTLAFMLPKNSQFNSGDSKQLQSIAQAILDKEGDGWIADSSFGSQNSFYYDSKQRQHARCTIRRWI